ncbi:MAG: class I SAM-dependent methyltransferase [Bryobacteraceae bacterium]
MKFQDYFSGHAADYAKYRPDYPRALFEWLAKQAPSRDVAVDCATGNGQAARGLAEFFGRVEALDASADQIANGEGPPNVHFGVAVAESTGLPDQSADLITIAQAFHWLDHPRVYAEARRVLRPGGILAAFGYARFVAEEPVMTIARDLLWKPLERYWPPERRLVETGYRTIEFPFDELQAPDVAISLDWTLEDLLAYVSTWSATKNYLRHSDGSLLTQFADQLVASWPDGVRRQITMPIFVRAGRVVG